MDIFPGHDVDDFDDTSNDSTLDDSFYNLESPSLPSSGQDSDDSAGPGLGASGASESDNSVVGDLDRIDDDTTLDSDLGGSGIEPDAFDSDSSSGNSSVHHHERFDPVYASSVSSRNVANIIGDAVNTNVPFQPSPIGSEYSDNGDYADSDFEVDGRDAGAISASETHEEDSSIEDDSSPNSTTQLGTPIEILRDHVFGEGEDGDDQSDIDSILDADLSGPGGLTEEDSGEDNIEDSGDSEEDSIIEDSEDSEEDSIIEDSEDSEEDSIDNSIEDSDVISNNNEPGGETENEDHEGDRDSARSHISVDSSDQSPESAASSLNETPESLSHTGASFGELHGLQQFLQRNQLQQQLLALMAQPQQQEPTIIDLTAEPDSPVLQQRPAPFSGAERRRRGPVSQPAVIDLTGEAPDADDDVLPVFRRNRETSSRGQGNSRQDVDSSMLGMRLSLAGLSQLRFPALPEFFQIHGSQPPPQQPHHHYTPPHNDRGTYMRNSRHFNHIHNVHNLHGHGQIDFELQILGQHRLPPMDNPLLGNPPELNYQANGILHIPHAPVVDKPPHIPPPPARQGFTRDTGDDVVAVCASCDEELEYDPDGGPDEPPTKRVRTRKDREEHHFWAATACGHVYCRRCFDNRRNAIKGDSNPPVGFRSNGKAVLCAVEGCPTDVTAKRAWVGLFV